MQVESSDPMERKSRARTQTQQTGAHAMAAPSTTSPSSPTRSRTRLRALRASALVGALAISVAGLAPMSTGVATASQSGTVGPNNDISDVPGILVGNAANAAGTSGTTVLRMPATATAGVDSRGGAPITRETDLLKPTNEVQKVDGLLFTGGGEYGLGAGPGVMRWMAEHNEGFQVGVTPDNVVPIVPGAAINDIRPGVAPKSRVGYSQGYAAVGNATTGKIAQGNVGAGLGAVAAGIKGGLGSASLQVAPGIYVAALVVVNSTGTPVDPTAGCKLYGAAYGVGTEFAALHRPSNGCGTYKRPTYLSGSAVNRGSVVGVVATNLTLDKPMDLKLAEAAHDGTTRALGQAHGMLDGDTFWGLSTDLATPDTGALPECLHDAVKLSGLGCQVLWNMVIGAAQETVSRAITHAMLSAKTTPVAKSYCDTFLGACASSNAATASASSVAPTLAGIGAVSRTDLAKSGARSALTQWGMVALGVLAATGLLLLAIRYFASVIAALPRVRTKLAQIGRRRAVVIGAGGLAAVISAAAVLVPAVSSASSPAFATLQASCQSDAACLSVIDRVGEAAKRAMARAIVHASISAKSTGGVTSYCDNFAKACTKGPTGYASTTGKTGRYNNLTDVPGIKVGTYTDPKLAVGTTVVLTPPGSVAGVEVRGSAPGGRGTDVSHSEMTAQPVDGLVLTGGSAYGLAAGDGVIQWLEERHKGTKLKADGSLRMPSVPTSVIFDLGRFGKPWLTYATPQFGYKAASAATAGPLVQGNVGGGAGAESGSIKGGMGYASEDLGNGLIVAAAVDINAAGLPYDIGNGCAYLGARYQLSGEFNGLRPPPAGCGSNNGAGFVGKASGAGKNTTIGIVATNLPLSRAMLSKLAQYGQDGLGIAIRPSHTYFDGDTVWSVSTGGYSGSMAQAAGPATTSTSKPAVSAVAGFGIIAVLARRARRRQSTRQ